MLLLFPVWLDESCSLLFQERSLPLLQTTDTALKQSTCSLLGDSGGKMASSFELGGSSLSLGTYSTHISEFKLTGFNTVSVSYKFRGKVPALSIVLSCLTFPGLTDLPCAIAHALISASAFLVIFCEVGFGICCEVRKVQVMLALCNRNLKVCNTLLPT